MRKGTLEPGRRGQGARKPGDTEQPGDKRQAPGGEDRGYGRGDQDPESPGREPRARGARGPGIRTRGARGPETGRRGPGMFELFYLLNKIRLGMFIVVTFHENCLKV